MAEKLACPVKLTREQQLEILAATGLLVQTLEVLVEALEEDGTALAQIPLPAWLQKPACEKTDSGHPRDGSR